MKIGTISMASLGCIMMTKQIMRLDSDSRKKDNGFLGQLMQGVQNIGQQFAFTPQFNEAVLWHIVINIGFFACGSQVGFLKHLGCVLFSGGFFYILPKYCNYFSKQQQSEGDRGLSLIGILSTMGGWVCVLLSQLLKSD